MFLGVLLLVMGFLMLLEKMGVIYGDFWDYLWPVALLALGASMILDRKKGR